MNHTNIIIIGAGASALMLAALLPKNTALLIESNAKIGEKIRISGGGKCNITNTQMGVEYYAGDYHFIKDALDAFDEEDLLTWLGRQGLEPVLRKERQYFCKDSAQSLIDIFAKELKKQQVLLNEKVILVAKADTGFVISTNKRKLSASHVVVASGGLSFPKIGASSIGYDIAHSFGHSIIKTAPALVGFTVQKDQFFFKALSGASTDVKITVNANVCEGALLFTHKGISGPCVLDASLYWEKGQIEIDFMPDFSFNEVKGSKKLISTLLPMSKSITKAFLVQLGVKDKPLNMMHTEELDKLQALKAYRLSPAGTFGYSKAEVTKGGVYTEEVEAHSMMSKKIKGLYFIGEVLDVTGQLGGYNFQWAFSSAFLSFKNLRKNI